jgi:MerR family transcriptional regulator, light-induced transcriptional regulator
MMTTIQQTPTFNLGVVLQETGINADTLRAWERRYGLPKPARSEGGHRLYSQSDIETIKWLLSRQEEGMSISKAINLWRNLEGEGRDPLQELPSRVGAIPKPTIEIPTSAKIQDLREQWVSACLEFNEAVSEQIISHAFALFPAETVCFDILFAGLSQIGESWYQGHATVQQEHFASALVARRLNALIATAPAPFQYRSLAVGCPQHEDHELPALLITYLLRSRGWHVVYLGANVPLLNFEKTIAMVKTDLMILVAQTLRTAASLKEVALALNAQNVKVAFGGRVFNRLPALVKQVPGSYLGEDLRYISLVVEKIFNSSQSRKMDLSDLRIDFEARSYFTHRRPLLEEILHTELADQMPFEYLQIANQHMAEDIAAAITLGNIDFLDPELDWIQGLLNNAALSEDLLAVYLQSYQQAADQVFDSRGQEILTWMQEAIRKFSR